MATVDDLVRLAQTLSPAERLRLIERLWESMPADAPTVLQGDSSVKRRLMESGAPWMEPVPWPIVERLVADSLRSSRPKVYSVPRRFDLATIFIVTVAYSLLFAGMSLAQLPPVAILAVAGFITLVGVGQALLFGGKKPRGASIIVGAGLYGISLLGFWIYDGPRAYPLSTLLAGATSTVIGGGILGYLAGVCVGAVFLLADILRRRFQWRSYPKEVAEREKI